MSFWLWIVVIMVILFVLSLISGIVQAEKEEKEKNELTDRINKINDFSVTNLFISANKGSSIAIDENSKKLCFIKKLQTSAPVIIDYKDILSSEIIEDGESITKTSRASQAGGALLGGLLLGGVGAVIGGLSGKKTTSGKVKSISLRVVVNNTDNPDHYISFLAIEVKKDSILYKTAIDTARKWQSIINILIHQADKEDNEKLESPPLSHTISKQRSITQELEKLAELKNKGILTDEEFLSEKKKLLNS